MIRWLRRSWVCFGLGASLFVLAGCGGGETLGDPPESVVVDLVVALSAPVDGVVTADLRDRADVTLEVGTARGDLWRDMLQHSLDNTRPVYLELEPETRRIQDLELPYVSPAHSVDETAEGAEVQLIYSAAIHFLYLTQPKYQAMLALLQDSVTSGASLVVSEKDQVGIVDVRPDTFSATP
ncbi:MAG TPA: hypothetical protein PK668_26085 [Myxococcota bacterium]|nr:hypothetical protein [Myxococcota bacterium]HRY96996.1 hypothetical protein [Myxococcota bacterium]HSA23027.1 hypothetical protein [Myxococcota bacterium]